MRILFLTHSFNSLAQRLFVELREQGHEVSVELDINDATSLDAVDRFDPALVIAPFLKRRIPASIWRTRTCFVVHPGIVGDRGPSSLDWAVLDDEREWGVTVLQANAEMDAGDIWASETFPMRDTTKASVYRSEVGDAAVRAVSRAVRRFADGGFKPRPLNSPDLGMRGRERPLLKAEDRRIDWERDNTTTVLRKIRSADGFPGLADEQFGRRLYLYDAKPAPGLAGPPGAWVATSGEAVGIATTDSGVWVGHLRDPAGAHPFKLPAVDVMPGERPAQTVSGSSVEGYRPIRYERDGDVGFLHFDFYNGAMGTGQCQALLSAYEQAVAEDTKLLVLCGGPDFWSNGIHLNRIEASSSPADASWENINAIDDLAEAIIRTRTQLTVAALRGNAGAGGVFLARAADLVWAHDGVVLNPHYKDMGNLFGSEFWTYLLPKACGEANAARIAAMRLPVSAREANELCLVNTLVGSDRASFMPAVREHAAALAAGPDYAERLARKLDQRDADEAHKPLADYRDEELERMRTNFYGFDPSYHVARYNFVYKVPKSRTPITIAAHRRSSTAKPVRNAS